MKCPKCGYTSFPYLESCRKCGHALAEQRAALGVYALRPDPPDLLLAYQAVSADVAEAIQTQPVPAPSIGLAPLEEIELELVELEPTAPSTDEVEEQAGAAPDLMLTLDRGANAEGEFPLVEPGGEQPSSHETATPPSLDLGGLGGMTLELENTVGLEAQPAESPQTLKDAAEAPPVYDLDLGEDLDGLTLRPLEDGARTEDAANDEEVMEYTLEIEDEVEFEVDELKLEQDDDAGAEDDHGR